MGIERNEDAAGNWSINATGPDVGELRGASREVSETERDRRLSNDHPKHDAPGVGLLFQPASNIVGWLDGRIVYREPIGNAVYEEVEGGYSVVSRE